MKRSAWRNLPLHVVAVIVGLGVVLPVLYGVLGGFKDTGQLATTPFGWPDPWVWNNYTEMLTSSGFWRPLWNSTVIAVATTFLVVATSAMAAFIFARFAFRGRELLFTLFTLGLMFPFAVAILPLYIVIRELSLLDNPLGVILPQAAFGLPVTIIILRSFFRTIPAEVEESATLDGCTPFGFFWRILLPMSRPALATVSVLAVVASWNNFLLPLVVFNQPEQWALFNWGNLFGDGPLFSGQAGWTLPQGVQQFQGQYAADTARILAYVVLAMIPALGFYAVAERQLIGGLASGAVKG